MNQGEPITIAQQFERWVDETPEQTAVVTETTRHSYAELNALASSIASRLSTVALDRDLPVAILLPESADLYAAIIGISKADRIFITLDITAPPQALRAIITHAKVGAIVCDDANKQVALSLIGNATALCCISERPGFFGEYKAKQPSSSQHVSFIVYTSGTTGSPKGVAVSHASINERLKRRRQIFELSLEARVAHLLPTSFSAGLNQVLGALLSGGSLYPVALTELSLTEFSDWLQRMQVTHLHMVGSLLRVWLGVLSTDMHFKDLRILSIGSEPLYGADIVRLRPHLGPDCVVINNYSTSEVGVVTFARHEPTGSIEKGLLPVGKPVDDIRVTIETEFGVCVPQGGVGEIVLKGERLTPGYWNDVERTASAFRTDPIDNQTVYRTGDKGRYLPDGRLQHLGRLGGSLKLRGHLVRLEEIASNILEMPQVNDCVVLTANEDTDHISLIAYAVLDSESTLTPEQMRSELSRRVPSHMVPNRIVLLDQLPLTSRGKVDQEALRSIQTDRALPPAYEQPANALEVSIATVWQEVLGQADISTKANFFDIGGTSLHALEVMAILEDKHGFVAPPTQLLLTPTIATLAGHFALGEQSASARIAPFRSSQSGTSLFVMHAVFGDVMYAHSFAQALTTDIAVYGVLPVPLDGAQRVPRGMPAIVDDYLQQLRSVQPKGPYLLAGYSFGGFVALEVAQRLLEMDEQVEYLALIDPNYDGHSAVAGETQSSRLRRHVRNVSISNAFRYVTHRLRATFERQQKLIWEAGAQVQNEVRTMLGMPIHGDRRREYYRYIFSEAARRYRPQPYPGGIELIARQGYAIEQSTRWGPIAKGGLNVHELPGTHAEIVRPPLSEQLAAVIDQSLSRSTIPSATGWLKDQSELPQTSS